MFDTAEVNIVLIKQLQTCVLPHLCCDAIPQQDFNPMLFPIPVPV